MKHAFNHINNANKLIKQAYECIITPTCVFECLVLLTRRYSLYWSNYQYWLTAVPSETQSEEEAPGNRPAYLSNWRQRKKKLMEAEHARRNQRELEMQTCVNKAFRSTSTTSLVIQ